MLSLAVIVLMLACGIFIDLRWLIVALMLLTIVVPGIMVFLYLSYALSPRCIPCVHNHYIKVKGDTLSIIYTVTTRASDDEEPEEKTVTVNVPHDDIDSCRVGLNYFTITMRRPFGLLKIPYSSLPDPRKFAEWVKTGKY